jgi:hypothetical protein
MRLVSPSRHASSPESIQCLCAWSLLCLIGAAFSRPDKASLADLCCFKVSRNKHPSPPWIARVLIPVYRLVTSPGPPARRFHRHVAAITRAPR